MDSLTQIVLGAAVGEAILGKKVGNKAPLWGAIAGTIPDLDVLANLFTDVVHATEFHRGFMHSIVFCVLFSPVLGYLAFKIHKKEAATWQNWSWLMFGALVTHPMLDCHTAFGTQLFWPWEHKITFNNIFVVDPLYTIPFLICVLIVLFLKRENPKRRFFNHLGLILSTSYMALTLVFKGVAHNQLSKSLEAQGIVYTQLESKPTPLNSILWTGFVQTEDAFYIGYYSLLDHSLPVQFHKFPKKQNLLGDMAKEDLVKRLIKLTRGWYNIEKEGDKILFYDLRFGSMQMNNDPKGFVMNYVLFYENNKLQVIGSKPKREGIGEAMKNLWERLKGI